VNKGDKSINSSSTASIIISNIGILFAFTYRVGFSGVIKRTHSVHEQVHTLMIGIVVGVAIHSNREQKRENYTKHLKHHNDNQ
jgi:fructose-specific phosphotransferase system IIC component